MLYVTDTHSLIWFLSEDNSLSKKAKDIFENAEKGECTIVIPTIVLAELLYICENKDKKHEFSDILEKMTSGVNYASYNLDLDVVLGCRELIKVPEMHDKIITATAKILNAMIITKDKEIINSGYVKTIW